MLAEEVEKGGSRIKCEVTGTDQDFGSSAGLIRHFLASSAAVEARLTLEDWQEHKANK